jgi:glycosyltransferase involved in cell wall biosynthesis
MISHFFPPMGGGGVQRVTKFVKYLSQCGWRTTVICGDPDDYWMRDETLLHDVPESARVIRTAGATGLGMLRRVKRHRSRERRSSRGFGVLRRAATWVLIPDSYVGWRSFALRAAEKVLERDPPDAVLSTGPPETNHLVGLELKQRTRLPWLVDFRDPWVALHLFEPPTRWHRERNSKLERAVLERADCLVATTAWLRDLLRERHPGTATRLYVIRNGFDPADFPVHRPDPTPGLPLRLVHAGMLTMTRSVDGLLHGLRLLHVRRPELNAAVKIELLGARETANDALVGVLGLEECVRFRGYVPHEEAIAAMLRADVLLLVKHTEPRYLGLVPGKLYEYLGAGRPILALVPESEAAELVRRFERGLTAPPDDPESICAALEQLVEAKRGGTLHARYASEAPAALTRLEQARNLAALLDQIAPTSNRGGA